MRAQADNYPGAMQAVLEADHLPDGADLVNLGVHRLRDLGR